MVLANSKVALTASAIVIRRREYPEFSKKTTVVELSDKRLVCKMQNASDDKQTSSDIQSLKPSTWPSIKPTNARSGTVYHD